MTRYTEELIKLSNEFLTPNRKELLEQLLEQPSNYSMYCLFKSYDEERLYNLTRNSVQTLAKPNISIKVKSDNEKFLSIVLGAFQARYEEIQNESNLI